MEKFKKYKEIFIVAVVILGLAFYWFQLRPVQIKKECSWFTQIIPADAGVTKEQAEINKKAFTECSVKNDVQGTGAFNFKVPCNSENIEERAPVSEREFASAATKSEYEVCLRRNGLSK